MFSTAHRKPTALLIVFLTTLIMAVYWPALGGHFLAYDDTVYVTRNPWVKAGLDAGSVRWAFTSLGYASNWHPLTWLSHMADVELYGLSPRGHHLSSILLHVLNSILIFLLLKGLTGAQWRPFLVAALFGLHPLHVESAAWISERKDVLAACLGILTLWSYLKYLRSPSLRRYVSCLLLFALGLMAKPMLVSLPLIMLILDFWPLGRLNVRRISLGALVAEKIPFGLMAASSSFITCMAQEKGGALGLAEKYPLGIRAGNALVSLMAYISSTAWPRGLAFFYPHPGWGISPWSILTAILILTGLTATLWRQGRRRPWLPAGWFWFLLTLAPVLGLVQVGGQARADRYTYLPLAGLFLMAVWSLEEVVRRKTALKPLVISGAAVILALLGISAGWQTKYWRDSRVLFRRAIEVTQGNWLAHNNLGKLLSDEGKHEEAAAHFLEALRFRPTYATAHYNLGNVLYDQGKHEEAVASYRRALYFNPRYPEAYVNLGETLAGLGRLEVSAAVYRQGITFTPGDADLYNNLGVSLQRMGRSGEALSSFRRALDLDPRHAKAYFNIGSIMELEGKPDEARSYYVASLRVDPGYVQAREALKNLKLRSWREK